MAKKVYLRLTLDGDGKKVLDFGPQWGSMTKEAANAEATITGDGLVVVDVDTKKLEDVDPKIIDALGEPTVETTRGYHWYLWTTNSDALKTRAKYAEYVDVRSDGGLVISSYWGDEDLSYRPMNDADEMSLELEEYLLYLMDDMTKAVGVEGDDLPYFGEQWSDPGEGQRHDAAINYIIRDYRAGCTVADVENSYKGWLQTCGIRESRRELGVMAKRMGGLEKFCSPSPLEGELLEEVEITVVEEMREADIDKMIEDKVDINEVLMAIARHDDMFKVEEYCQSVKKAYEMPIGMVRDGVAKNITKKSSNFGADKFFDNNRIIWDPDMQIFCEVNHEFVQYHKHKGFKQTLSSKTGLPVGEALNLILSQIPTTYLRYAPGVDIDFQDEFGRDCINVYKGVKFSGAGRRIPKYTNLLLDSLFDNDMTMKDEFINWLAFIVQARKRSGIAWAFMGVQGSGKGIITTLVSRLVGMHNTSMNLTDAALQSQFNPYMKHKLLVHLNEISNTQHGRHGVSGKLKSYITDEYVVINEKGIGEVSVENHCNFILNSNSKAPLELDEDDRRWNMVLTSTKLKERDWFYQGVGDTIEAEWKRFGAYLMSYEMDVDRATRAVENSKLKKIVTKRTTTITSQVMDMIEKSDGAGVIKKLHLDDEDLMTQSIKWAAENKTWDVDLLLFIYRSIVGNKKDKNDITKTSMTQSWINYSNYSENYKQGRNANEEGDRKMALFL